MRRKRRYTWFPILGTQFGGGTENLGVFFNQLDTISPVRRDLVSNTVVTALVPDFSSENTADATTGDAFVSTLRDRVEGQDWLLKRLVGKIFVQNNQVLTSETEGWPYALVKAGFFVARADDDNQGVCSLAATEASPWGIQNVMNPWIWQRSWMLSNPGWGDASVGNSAGWPGRAPCTNYGGYGSGVMDGPHIDSRVARRITKEHRLWFAITALGWAATGNPNVDVGAQAANISYTLDLRVLGAMRKAKSVSSF